MSHHPFLGFPRYLDRAAAALAHPEAGLPAGRITTLAAIANLCAQASTAEEFHHHGILEKATEFRHQLHVAAMAADLMIEDVFASKCRDAAVSSPDKRPTKAKPQAD